MRLLAYIKYQITSAKSSVKYRILYVWKFEPMGNYQKSRSEGL